MFGKLTLNEEYLRDILEDCIHNGKCEVASSTFPEVEPQTWLDLMLGKRYYCLDGQNLIINPI